jgi:hypothetical protein
MGGSLEPPKISLSPGRVTPRPTQEARLQWLPLIRLNGGDAAIESSESRQDGEFPRGATPRYTYLRNLTLSYLSATLTPWALSAREDAAVLCRQFIVGLRNFAVSCELKADGFWRPYVLPRSRPLLYQFLSALQSKPATPFGRGLYV